MQNNSKGQKPFQDFQKGGHVLEDYFKMFTMNSDFPSL